SVFGLIDRAIACRDRRAVRIDLRLTDRRRHSVDQLVGRRVLEAFRFLVDAVPRVPQRLGEIGFDDAMPPQSAQRCASPALGEPYTVITLVSEQSLVGKPS